MIFYRGNGRVEYFWSSVLLLGLHEGLVGGLLFLFLLGVSRLVVQPAGDDPLHELLRRELVPGLDHLELANLLGVGVRVGAVGLVGDRGFTVAHEVDL